MNIKYCYITQNMFPNGEYQVEGHLVDGSLVFGFRTFDYWGIREKARYYTPSFCIPVFGKKPKEVIN